MSGIFGLGISPSAAPGADPVRDALEAEALGYDFVSCSDHPAGTSPTYEVWTMLTWVAAATSRIRLATRVLGTPYRPPAMVAKMAETLHRLSGGRLILGLGGGYSDEEFRAFGLGVPTPGEKVDGMVEAITIIRGLWSESNFTYTGTRYHVESADISPKPDTPIPIWLGTYGNRALAATGELADGWIPSLGFAPPEQATAMRERILTAADKSGREITCVYNVPFHITPTAPSSSANPPHSPAGSAPNPPRSPAGSGPNPLRQYSASAATPSGTVSGSVQAVTDQLLEFTRIGFTSMNFTPTGPNPRHQAELLAQHVLPTLRSTTA